MGDTPWTGSGSTPSRILEVPSPWLTNAGATLALYLTTVMKLYTTTTPDPMCPTPSRVRVPLWGNVGRLRPPPATTVMRVVMLMSVYNQVPNPGSWTSISHSGTGLG